LRVWECCAGEGWRRLVRTAFCKIKYYVDLRKKETSPYNKMMEE
jgi:hypothetical protein